MEPWDCKMGCLMFLQGKKGMLDIEKLHLLSASFARTPYFRFPSSLISSYQEETAEVVKQFMHQSNGNFNIPPPRANPGHLTTFCAWGVGNLTGKAFLGVGNLTFAWVGWGKLNRKFQIPNGFFFPAPKSPPATRVWKTWKTSREEMLHL